MQGLLNKMHARLESTVQYELALSDQRIALNPLLGRLSNLLLRVIFGVCIAVERIKKVLIRVIVIQFYFLGSMRYVYYEAGNLSL